MSIKKIFVARTRNNGLWMQILEIALEAAPERTRKVLRRINANDIHISTLLHELTVEPGSKTTEDELGS